MTHLPGYRIVEPLYAGTRTQVYRGVRECDRHPVVIKVLRHPFPSFNELVQFRNQYTIAKSFDLPTIVKPLALEPYQNGYALVMADFGGISLKKLLEQTGSWGNLSQRLTAFFQIALQVVDAVSELHHQRVIHKDLKPGNILLNPDTLQVKLTDFSIASLLPRETQEIQAAKALEGTLAYLSPEQTGRMNRGVDYRSDFYALGVTFYQLLTGQLPFATDDPMELIHCHLAKQPAPLHEVRGSDGSFTLPNVLSDIVLKLMSKNAEDRYQSALGLKYDLEHCLAQWQETHGIEPFELGSRDVGDRFLIPESLYGRAAEVQTLLDAFERVSQGHTELMLVAGFSGIGKTAVVNEVHKPIARQHGYFIKGKFDQFNRNIPLSGVVQALRNLMRQLLSESDGQLQVWKSQILAAVGDSGQVLIDVMPELERLIGAQPAAVELSGTAAQNRFNLLFQQFIQIFTTPDHPLVMFLDDLQWADAASLSFINLLMTELATGYLLLIGAYRDNEVSPAHPLMLTIAAIAKAAATVNTITLQPLSPHDLNRLVADTLHCTEVVAQPLTDLVVQKTQGNPFFATQFLKALHQDGLIEFDWQAGHWQCDIAQVREAALTDDVVEFMALQLQKLPTATQAMLTLAACIGNQFDLTTLAIVSEHSEIATATDLWSALQQGLVLPQSQIYKFYIGRDTPELVSESHVLHYRFLHDRVQQAAYSLIPDDQKQITHLKIGQLMLQNTPEALQEEHVFEIVSQLNYGVELLTDQTERDRLAQLNLKVGRKALASTAYEAAVGYFKVGRELLASNAWELHYALCLALHESAAEAAYLSGDFAAMEQLVEQVLQQSNSILDRIKAYEIKIQAYASQTQFMASLEVALEGLQHLNVYFPSAPTGSDIEATFANVTAQVQTITIANLANLPPMQDAHARSSLRLLAGANAAAFQADPNLFVLIVLKMVSLSIEYGNSAESTLGYGLYGLLMSCILGDWETGYQLGQLALNLLDNFHDKQIECKTKFVVNTSVRFRKEHLRQTIQSLQEAYQIGLENGDIEFAGYSILHHCDHCFFLGDSLFDLEQKIPVYIASLEKLKEVTSSNILRIYLQTIFHLTQGSPMPGSLIGEAYNELQDLPRLQAAQNQKGLFYLYFAKLFLHYFFQDFDQALTMIQSLENYLEGGRGNAVFPIFNFYDSLTCLALYSETPEAEREHGLEQVNVNQDQLRQWAAYAPLNYQHKWFLVEAERNRVLGLRLEAIENYDRAIAGAKENGYIQEESLANELAARFYLHWGKEKVAAGYMQEAYYGYARWGAKAKTDDLEKRYPRLLASIFQTRQHLSALGQTNLQAIKTASSLNQTSHSTSYFSAEAIDFAAILKASQALSSEIQLEKLVATLLQVVMESSGATKAALLISQDDSLTVEAIAMLTDAGMTLLSVPLSDSDLLPLKLIHYVKRSLSTIVLDDATTQTEFAADPYLAQHQPRSLLCTPIVNQGKLIGLLYLENPLTVAAFTSDRLEVIHLLCTQAAISLENARLYSNLQASEARYQRLAENVPGVIYQFQITANGDWQIPYFSPGCREMFGVSSEQAMADAQIITGMVHPEDVAEFAQSITLSAQTLQPWKWAGRIVLPSGQLKWIQGVSRPELHPNGTTVWDGMLLDISDRKQVEQQLSMSIKALDSHFDNSLFAIIEWDKDRKIKRWSEHAEQIFGWSEAEIQAMDIPAWKFVYEEDFGWVSSQIQALRNGLMKRSKFENRNYRKDGTIITCEWHSSTIFDDAGNLQSMLTFAQDISDRKTADAALQKSLQRSESLNRVFQAIRQSFELDIIFATATAEMSHLLPGLDCYVVQYLPTQAVWKHVAEFRHDPDIPSLIGLEIPDLGNPFAEQLKRLQIVRVEATDRLVDPINQDVANFLPGAWVLIPLLVEGEIWGSFTLNTQEQPFAWTDEQVELAQTVAAQLEVAIQQAELYQQVEQEKQNLLKSQIALLQAQQIAQVGSWELDAATQVMVWSDTLYQIFGFDPALPEPDFAEVMMNHVHPEDRPRLEQALMQAMTQGIPYEIDLRIFRADGSMGHMEARAEAMLNEQGQIVKIFGTSLDISDRKQAEKQLQTLVEATAATTGQDFFPTLVSHMATALNVAYALVTEEINGELHALAFWANGALQPTFTYHPAKTPCEWALRDGMFYCPCLVQQMFPQDLDLVQMGAESYMGIALRDRQGQAIGNLCILNTQPIPEPQQAENLLRVFAARASAELERERATQALEELNQELEVIVNQRTAALTQRTMQLEVSNKELESFSYSVSHDLRAPLRHINGFVSALQQKLDSHQALTDPKVVHYLQVIETSSQKMSLLIDGLLTLSRLGRKPMEYKPVLLRSLVDEAIALVRNSPETTVPPEFVIGNLPTVQGDATLLQQVLSNLIGNAVKFSRHHPDPRIEIGTLPEGTIFVQDNGVGFQMAYADKLFGAFQRLHAQTEFEGTGIGLAIVQRIIHRHGGIIWAESQPNQGATFYFTVGEATQ